MVQTIGIPSDVPRRLLLAAQCGLPYFAPEVRKKIQGLLSLENFALLGAFVAADVAFAGTGVGTAVNVVAGGLMVILLGNDLFTGSRHLIAYYKTACVAKTGDQFKKAGREFAKGVTTIGVDTLIVMLMRRDESRVSGKVESKLGGAESKAAWFAFIDSMEFNVPQNRGVIWAGLENIERARYFAQRGDSGAVLLNDVLDQYRFEELIKRDFGESNTAETYRIWERASMRYAESLKGKVTAYVESTKLPAGSLGDLAVPKLRGLGLELKPGEVSYAEGKLEPGRGAGRDVEISGGRKSPSVIITEIEELIDSNPNITSIIMKDVKTGKELGIYTPGARSSRFH